jgi:hypothetical protein
VIDSGGMRFYGLLDRYHAEVIEFYESRETADRELSEILHDEPDGRDVRDRDRGLIRAQPTVTSTG